MTKHKHAELMKLYAEDARETDKPWERWQFRYAGLQGWHPCDCAMYWHDTWEYRRKPKTSRERFEAWFRPAEYLGSCNVAWEAWQEAERQAKESDTAGGE